MSEKPGRSRGEILEEGLALGLIVAAMAAYEWDVRDIAQPAVNLMVMRPVLIAGWVLAAIVLALYVVRPLMARPSPLAGEAATPGAALHRAAPMLIIVGALVVYTAIFPVLPFLVTTTFFMAASLVGLGNRSPAAVAGVSLATAIGLYLMGERVLGITLP